MSGAGSGGAGKAGRGGTSKKGKPRPGTGGYGKHKLEGKGPTPPAHMRPGHPAQRRASAAARPAGARPDTDGPSGFGRGPGSSPRRGDGPEVVTGRNPVVEALRAHVPGSTLYLAYRIDPDDRIREAVKHAADAGIPVLEVNRSELDRVTQGAVHQGLALRVRPYQYAHPDDLITRATDAGQVPLIVALDGVTDPRNLGAIARSAAAFGAHGVLIPGRRTAGVTAGAWKASAGTLARLPVAQAPNLARALVSYQEAGLFVVGLATGGSTDVAELDIAASPLVLVVGSEGKGLSRIVSDRCDLLARIPIESAESLNAGVAAGIALYAAARRRATLTS